MSRNAEFRHFPSLTPEEFSEVCHHLDRRYCQATLGPLRKRWKLRVCKALDLSFGMGPEYATYIQIIRPLEESLEDEDLLSHLEQFSFGERPTVEQGPGADDQAMINAEEADEVRYYRPSLPCRSSEYQTDRLIGSPDQATRARFWLRSVRDPLSSDIQHSVPMVHVIWATSR